MIVSDFIEATHNHCLHFFVDPAGRSAFLGVTGQALDRTGRWRGTITYKKRTARTEEQLNAILDEIYDY
ncbi:uncharacterized protein P884DRAFT_255037 [Thermothelomyces heterothallicus CBS 202.75]|uniref:uncharacterized protein n=1 Tax=Thermothelomyces heterothallicus CBS 202.75 TaxID=1149848 RepID=UPI00374203B4